MTRPPLELYSETSITADNQGHGNSLHRAAFRILRPQGVEQASMMQIFFDHETRGKHLHAWGVPVHDKTIEIKDKDAVEVSPFDFELFSDDRALTLRVPGMHVGDMVVFEWEQQGRPQLRSSTTSSSPSNCRRIRIPRLC